MYTTDGISPRRRAHRQEPGESMTQIPPATRSSLPPCGHEASFSGTRIDIRRLTEASPDNHVLGFLSLGGGDRTLTAEQCRCYHVTYALRRRGQNAEII